MTLSQRLLAAMRYQAVDRIPWIEFGYWPETLDRWKREGLPDEITAQSAIGHFGFDSSLRYGLGEVTDLGVEAGLCPRFPAEVIEDRGDEEIYQQDDGVRVRRKKNTETIPHAEAHLLVDRESWAKHYLPRLDPSGPQRFPPDWDRRMQAWRDAAGTSLRLLPGGSTYGWLRNWMGVEAVSAVLYDDPAWFEEMVGTIGDCVLGVLQRLLETGLPFDACAIWEDMCYSGGPLMSPAHVKKYLAPQYRRISELLDAHGIDIRLIDSDGRVDELIPIWLDAGINCVLPIEVGQSGGDPIRLRREFGRDLRMIGGFDKRILRGPPAAITAELLRLDGLVEEGGYVPMCDHWIPPDVSLENYRFFVGELQRQWRG